MWRGEEHFKSSANDILKLWTSWCAGSQLIVNWIMRGHTLMLGEVRSAARWRWGGTKQGGVGGHYALVVGGGWVFPSDAAAEPFKSDSLGRCGEATKACGHKAWNQRDWDRKTRQSQSKQNSQNTLMQTHLLWATVETWHPAPPSFRFTCWWEQNGSYKTFTASDSGYNHTVNCLIQVFNPVDMTQDMWVK